MASRQKMLQYASVCETLVVGACLFGCASRNEAAPPSPAWQPPAEAVAHVQELPQIGKWMFDARYEPAHWLGELHQGKHLREPINVLIVDGAARSAREARNRLVRNFAAAGYLIREGHSTGYRGYIDGVVYEQIPDGKEHAFSNEPFEAHNNHGRMLGPHPYRGAWLFIGAFSRERMDLLEKVKHCYVSFNQARDDLSQRLETKTDYKIKAFLNLDNAVIGDAVSTTGDHDGIAVLLAASQP